MQLSCYFSCRSSGARFSARRVFAFVLILFTVLPSELFAKRYLTVAEAQKVCFPKATRFENKTIRFNSEQMSKIEKASSVKVKIPGMRYSLAWRDKEFIGAIAFDFVLGKAEVIDYCVAITPENAVQQIEVMVYRESHGYEIRRPTWRKQFLQKTIQNKLRINDDIANISGATISCRNITNGVKRVLQTWRLEIRPSLVAAGNLPAHRK